MRYQIRRTDPAGTSFYLQDLLTNQPAETGLSWEKVKKRSYALNIAEQLAKENK